MCKHLLRYEEIARAIASNIDRPNRHVSFIFKGKSVVSVGTNTSHSHPLAKRYGYLFEDCHSELRAYIGTKHKFWGEKRSPLILLNFHFNPLGVVKLARPCSLCLPWCTAVFSKIYFSTPTGIARL